MELTELDKRREESRKCMKCGFCAFFCPVYKAELNESSVARGRQMFVRNMLKGTQEITPELAWRFNQCTLCRTCETFCPAKAPTADLVQAARADIVSEQGLPWTKDAAFKVLLKNRGLLGAAIKWASWWQWMLPRTEGREGHVRHLPQFLEALSQGRQIPELARKQLRQVVPEVVTPPPGVETRMKVGFFSGCSQEYLYPESGERLVHLLAAHGCEVHFPREQGCCGTPVITSGDLALGREMADRNVAALEQYDYVVSGCASCSSMLKEYQHLLGDTPERQQRYEAFGAKVRGVSEFIFAELDLDPSLFTVRQEYRGARVTWHDPCHLVRYQNVREQPRRLLRGVEGIEYVEMPNADQCCGMAGTFTVYYYDTSKKIGDRKADGIEATNADIVVTECPGCVMQITDTLARRGMPQKVMHILELFE